MVPKVIVEYERTPYVYKNGNVRITFDRNITSSSQVDQFFNATAKKRPILPAGMQLLEVKYDEYLPEDLVRKGFACGVLDTKELQQIIRGWQCS